LDKDANVDYTMKDQVIFNSPRSHCEELNDEAIQYNMSFRAEREILTLNEVKNLRSLTRVRDDKWFTSYCLFSRFAPSG